ncbi:MAG: sigma-70 family RNA polymerase sigma factor [Bacilli bacterium]
MNYRDYNDYELLDYIAENSEEANEIIYKKYEPLIIKFARKIYPYAKNSGLEINDLTQEGRLGLSKAIDQYSDSKDTLFYTYAKKCIERKIISSVLGARRLKHKLLNDSISFDYNDEEGNNYSLDIFVKDEKGNPENIIAYTESYNELLKLAEKELTELEYRVFELKLNGFDYKEISEILEKEQKSIDNALQRIKNKLKKIKKI